ncbi:hypothetical protein AHF37_08775 [Paragonimus kellicotti]|nr:hypothetical protein AHF37_08775 [Paragonimus kellicotti]
MCAADELHRVEYYDVAQVNAQFAPTTTDSVAASSSVIFGNFLTETYRLEVSATAKASITSASETGGTVACATAQASATVDSSPSPPIRPGATDSDQSDPFGPEFEYIPHSKPDSMEAIVARNLALLGDEINRTYGPRLDSMIKILPADECPVEMFSNVARVLFSRGPTNWGQVVALFYFGYRLVIRRVRSGLLAAFRQVCKSLFSFCLQMNVFAWIAAQGGWVSSLFLSVFFVHTRCRIKKHLSDLYFQPQLLCIKKICACRPERRLCWLNTFGAPDRPQLAQ